MFRHSFAALFILVCAILSHVASSPIQQGQRLEVTEQVVLINFRPTSMPDPSEDQDLSETLKPGRGRRPYENGELPPSRETIGWVDPRLNGGRLLDYTTKRLGEPLNIIISGLSDPYILTETGFHIYTKSIGFSEECFGMHYGNLHEADLGDGLGRKQEQFLARQHYVPIFGTCWESVRGGHHFRAWRQNGTLANSGAWFIGASKEEDSTKNHLISKDGYNLGRNFVVERAIAGSRWRGRWWRADVEWVPGLLQKGNVSVNHGIHQDGLVAVLTVKRL